MGRAAPMSSSSSSDLLSHRLLKIKTTSSLWVSCLAILGVLTTISVSEISFAVYHANDSEPPCLARLLDRFGFHFRLHLYPGSLTHLLPRFKVQLISLYFLITLYTRNMDAFWYGEGEVASLNASSVICILSRMVLNQLVPEVIVNSCRIHFLRFHLLISIHLVARP